MVDKTERHFDINLDEFKDNSISNDNELENRNDSILKNI
jgi:hypothetical protein